MLTFARAGRWMAFWIFSNISSFVLPWPSLVPLRRNSMNVFKLQQQQQQQWEPLPPPRGVSSNRSRHRERRRRLWRQEATTSSSSSIPEEVKDDSDSRQKQKGNAKPPQRRVNHRPGGFNSYLEVLLDETTMDLLHEMAVGVQSRIQQQEEKDRNEQEKSITTAQTGNNAQALSSQQQNSNHSSFSKKRKPLRFKPRSQGSLHMTLFFGGETICELPPEELSEWHQCLSERLAKSGFCLQHNHDDDNKNAPTSGKEADFKWRGSL
jgi:hypothetical protein